MATTMNEAGVAPRIGGMTPPQVRMESDITIRDILLMFWRRKFFLIGTVLVAAALTVMVSMMITPLFQATTLVAMERRGVSVAKLDLVASGLPGDESTFKSEIEILRSRDLAALVVAELELEMDPEFNKSLQGSPGMIAGLRQKLSGAIGNGGPGRSSAAQKEFERISTIDTFLSKLDVQALGVASRVMSVKFSSEDPELAALVPNTLSQMYLDGQSRTKMETAQRATELLNEQVTVLQQQASESEQAVEEYRQQSGLLVGKEITLTAQQSAEMNTQLVLAEAAWAEAQARYQTVLTLMNSEGGVESSPEALKSELIARLIEQQAMVERSMAELSMEYGPRHPRMIKLLAEREDMQSTIEAEIAKIVQGYENDVRIARARVDSIQRSLDQLENKIGAANSAEVELRRLQREARANQLILESFLAETKETIAEQDLELYKPDAKIISHADVPLKAYFPNTKLFLALAVVGSTFVAILLVLLIENLDRGLRSAKEIEEKLGVSLLALVPTQKSRWLSNQTPADYVVENTRSALAQSIRSLHMGIMLSGIRPDPQTILITSSQPGEGKSTTSACLARIRAMAGQKVVVLDMDFHGPGASSSMGSEPGAGLADFLAGNVGLKEIAQKDSKTDAYYITRGFSAHTSTDLLTAENLDRLFSVLKKHFDLIIIDSPPLMAVAESRMLARVADATVLVVRWAETKRDIVRLALRQILTAGGLLAGIALTQVDVKKNAQYGYPDSGYYTGAMSTYYQD